MAPLVRQETIRFLTVHIENALRFHRRTIKRQVMPHRCVRLLNLPYTAVYVTSCYFVTKVLYMVNVILQFYLMNLFLDTNQYSFFGFGAIHAILNGSDWQQSGIFPRVTMCDMQVSWHESSTTTRCDRPLEIDELAGQFPKTNLMYLRIYIGAMCGHQ